MRKARPARRVWAEMQGSRVCKARRAQLARRGPPGSPLLAHRVSGIYQPGDTVTLPDCELPTTGGRSTPLLPWGIGLAALGAFAVWFARRRRVINC